VTFLRRLFVRDTGAWAGRWPGESFPPWDGGSGAAEDRDNPRKAATTCGGAELKKLLAHADESTALAALDNPAVTIDLIASLVESAKSSPNVLAAIARRREWSGDPQIAKGLCMNPKTPFYATRALLVHLPSSELREISQSALVPPGLAHEAMAIIDKKRTRRLGR
jgi:hypothetical protein